MPLVLQSHLPADVLERAFAGSPALRRRGSDLVLRARDADISRLAKDHGGENILGMHVPSTVDPARGLDGRDLRELANAIDDLPAPSEHLRDLRDLFRLCDTLRVVWFSATPTPATS